MRSFSLRDNCEFVAAVKGVCGERDGRSCSDGGAGGNFNFVVRGVGDWTEKFRAGRRVDRRESGAAVLVEQRREGLDGNIRLLAQRSGSSNANEFCYSRLDDDAALCTGSERDGKRNSRRVGAMLATDGTLAISQPHWRSLAKREDSAVRAQDISTA